MTYHPSPIERAPLDPFTDQNIPEYQRVGLAFLAGYRNENTRTNYGQALRAWFEWCLSRNIEPLRGATRPYIDLWLRVQEEQQGLAPRTVNGRMNALSMYYKYAVMEGYIEGSPATWVKRPRIERVSSTQYLTRVELGAVLKLAEDNGPRDNFRDLAILCLLGLNGLRVSEVVGIDVEDLGRERGYRTANVRRKGDKTQTIPLAHKTTWAIDQLVGQRETGPLFQSKWTPGKRLDRGDVQRLVKKYAKNAGIKKRITPHSFRHSFVTLSLDAGASERDVQNSAGHADPRMVSYYDRNRTSLARNATHLLEPFVDGAT